MASRVYKLYATTSSNAAASCTIGQSGFIRAVDWAMVGQGAAVVTGAETAELAINQPVSNITTNDTPGTSISDNCLAVNIASSVSSSCKSIQGLNIPVYTGDRLYLNVATSGGGGTALALRAYSCHITVEQ